MSLTRDPEARQDMVPDEVWQGLEPDPEISDLEAQRDKLKNGRYRIRGTKHEDKVRERTKTVRMKKAQRERSIRAIGSTTFTIVPRGRLNSSLPEMIKSTKHIQHQRLTFTYRSVSDWQTCCASKRMTWISMASCGCVLKLLSSWLLLLGSEKRPSGSASLSRSTAVSLPPCQTNHRSPTAFR